MEILSKEFKPTALEGYHLEYRHTKNISWTFLQVQFIIIPI